MDIIAAPATAPGHAAIGVIRLSGAGCGDLAQGVTARAQPLPARRPVLVRILDEHGVALDQGLATRFEAGASYTGEEMVEFSGHGSPVVVRAVLDRFVAAGARLARPGEFTLRALQNGRMDLQEAAAVDALVRAETLAEARTAVRQLDGAASRELTALRADLVALLAAMEACVDFAPEHDVEVDERALADRMAAAGARIAGLSQAWARGEAQKRGIRVVIAGPPNAGKSSLFNRLCGEERALVTPVPGTTRDALHARLELASGALLLVDTAGMREAQDLVERLGVERSLHEASVADRLLWVQDGRETRAVDPAGPWTRFAPPHRLAVFTHADLPRAPQDGWDGAVWISNPDGAGVDKVLAWLDASAGGEEAALAALHLPAAQAGAWRRLAESFAAATGALPTLGPEAAVQDLAGALAALDTLTGASDPELVRDRLFRDFCIGK